MTNFTIDNTSQAIIVPEATKILASLSQAAKMLEQVSTATEAKKLMDRAAAAEYYFKKAKLGEEAIGFAHAIKIDAMAKLGEFLEQAEKNKGANGSIVTGSTQVPVRDTTPTLADSGFTKKLSSESQFLSRVKKSQPQEFHQIRAREKSTTQVRREVSRAAVRETAKLPSDKYRVIYADPPWDYDDKLTEDYGPAQLHFPPMKIDDICALPVGDLADDNAVLFLWVTAPMLREGLDVVDAWGFTYKNHFIWHKEKHNVGRYCSTRHELLFIGIRGSCLPDVPTLIPSVQSIPRTKHSVKPKEFRAIIDKLYPHGRRIELFARHAAPGWQRWGNQAPEDF